MSMSRRTLIALPMAPLLGCASDPTSQAVLAHVTPGLANVPWISGSTAIEDQQIPDVVSNGLEACGRGAEHPFLRGQWPPCPSPTPAVAGRRALADVRQRGEREARPPLARVHRLRLALHARGTSWRPRHRRHLPLSAPASAGGSSRGASAPHAVRRLGSSRGASAPHAVCRLGSSRGASAPHAVFRLGSSRGASAPHAVCRLGSSRGASAPLEHINARADSSGQLTPKTSPEEWKNCW